MPIDVGKFTELVKLAPHYLFAFVLVGLIQARVLYHASNRAVSLWDPRKLYTDINMELWAWQFLTEHPELIAEPNKKN